MNPGPAPRPPTDRPRLGLTPQVQNVAGNMNNMSLRSPSPSGSTVSLGRSNSTFDQLGSETNIIKEGWSKVKEEGGFMKGVFWSDKFLILREKQLDFLKNNTTAKVSFTIPLKDILNITRSDTHPYAFELTRGVGGSSQSPARDGPQKLIICRFETDNDVYAWIDGIYDRCPSMGGVSHPTGFTHRVHVGFDPINGGFTGLPPEWQKLLNSSALTKDDMERNPQAVVEALQFYHDTLQKRADDPKQFPQLMPTPSIEANPNKQLGYGGGSSIAPPRPQPPGVRQDAYSRSQSPAGYSAPSRTNTGGQYSDEDRRRKADDERRRQESIDRHREEERRAKQDLDDYNSSLPKGRTPLAKQELGGYGSDGGSSPQQQSSRYNATRPAPPAPSRSQDGQRGPAPVRQLASQRQAPTAPTQDGLTKVPSNSSFTNGSRNASPSSLRKPDPANGAQPSVRLPTGTTQQSQAKAGQAGQSYPKPLNVSAKQPAAEMDPIKKAEMMLTAKPPKEESGKKEQRMSSMTDAQVMERLRDVVSKDKPLDSYNKQKKIGQGASGSVYVARIRESATSPTAKQLLRDMGPRAQVAIKQMDLRNQPRKQLKYFSGSVHAANKHFLELR